MTIPNIVVLLCDLHRPLLVPLAFHPYEELLPLIANPSDTIQRRSGPIVAGKSQHTVQRLTSLLLLFPGFSPHRLSHLFLGDRHHLYTKTGASPSIPRSGASASSPDPAASTWRSCDIFPTVHLTQLLYLLRHRLPHCALGVHAGGVRRSRSMRRVQSSHRIGERF